MQHLETGDEVAELCDDSCWTAGSLGHLRSVSLSAGQAAGAELVVILSVLSTASDVGRRTCDAAAGSTPHRTGARAIFEEEAKTASRQITRPAG